MLEDLLHADGNSVRLSQEVNADGSRFLAEACEIGLEGIIAKRRSASYRPGRGGDWLKIKCITSETFLIVGYEPSSVALGGIGRLLLAAHGNCGLVYVGSVGTGFTVSTASSRQGSRRPARFVPASGTAPPGDRLNVIDGHCRALACLQAPTEGI